MKSDSAFNGNYIEYQIKGYRDKHLSSKEYFNIIRPYLSDIINDHSFSFIYGIILVLFLLKILMRPLTCIQRVIGTEIMIGSETDNIIDKIFKSFLQKYQEGLEESMRGSEFIFDSVDLLYYNLQKINLNRKGSSYIDSPKWLKNKKATTNPKNNEINCFQYALNLALSYQNIKKDLQRK